MLASIPKGGSTSFFLGLAMGLPICLTLTRDASQQENAGARGDAERSTIGALVGWSTGDLKPASIYGVEMKSVVNMALRVDIGDHYWRSGMRTFKENVGYGISDFFRLSWEEVVGEESYFFDEADEMTVYVAISSPA